MAPNCSVNNPRVRFVNLLGVGALACSFLLAACGEQSGELGERVTLLQKELDRTQIELQSATQALQASKEELSKLKGSATGATLEVTTPAPISSRAPSRESLEASYMAEAKALKKQLQGQLKDVSLGSFTLHNVQLPDNRFPITSWISLAFQAGDGKQYRLDFAVKADLNGSWVFPETSEITRRVAEARKIAATSTTSESKAGPSEPQPNVATTMPSSTTVTIEWPNSNAPAASRDTTKQNTEAAPRGPQAPQAPPAQGPKQVIPADRDVLIRF